MTDITPTFVPKIEDRFKISYFLWFLSAQILLIGCVSVDETFGLGFVFGLAFLLLIALIVVGWLVILGSNVFRRRWRRAVSTFIAPFASWAVLELTLKAGLTPDRVRFEFTKAHYLDEVAKTGSNGEPRLLLFRWSEIGGTPGANIVNTLVFDESDEIALEKTKRSEEWMKRASRMCPGTQMCSLLAPTDDNHTVTVEKLGQHFFVVNELYQ